MTTLRNPGVTATDIGRLLAAKPNVIPILSANPNSAIDATTKTTPAAYSRSGTTVTRSVCRAGHRGRILWSGTSSSIEIDTNSTNAGNRFTLFRVRVYRQNVAAPANFDFVGESEDISGSLSDGVTTYTLSTPITHREGDFIGCIMTMDGNQISGDGVGYKSGLDAADYVLKYNNADETGTNINFTDGNVTGWPGWDLSIVPIQTPPNIIIAGDSLIEGRPDTNGFLDPLPDGDAYSDMAPTTVPSYYLTQSIDSRLTAMNGAMRGTSAVDWAPNGGGSAYLTSNVIAYTPQVCVMALGYNDMGTGWDAEEDHILDIVRALQQSGIAPIFVTIPRHATTATLLDWNNKLALLCSHYQIPLVDAFGMLADDTRSGQVAAEYLNADGIHLTAAARKALARAIASQLLVA